MLSKNLTVLELLDLDLTEHDALHLHCICGQGGLMRSITIADLNRPGLALSGFLIHLRISVFSYLGEGSVRIYKNLLRIRKLIP